MGFVWLAVIGVAVAALLWRLGVSRALWSTVGAALMLGATGYALQGRPSLPGHPVEADAAPIAVDPGLVDLRDRMFGRFTADGAYMIAADAMTRDGDTASAVRVMLGGIRTTPGSVLLWTGLGSELAQHDGGVSPAALFAFRHAMRIGPLHPGPPFFAGLAYIEAGQFAEALPYWRRAVSLAPPKSDYRQDIAVRLQLLEQFLRFQDAAMSGAGG